MLKSSFLVAGAMLGAQTSTSRARRLARAKRARLYLDSGIPIPNRSAQNHNTVVSPNLRENPPFFYKMGN